MDGFEAQVLAKLPLAEAVWLLMRQVVDDAFLTQLFDEHRGTGCEAKVTFSLLVKLVADALLRHAGSGRQSFHEARKTGQLTATNEAVYGKLRRLRPELAEAFLLQTTQRLRQLLPPTLASETPAELRDYRVLVVDGKKLKRLPKRLLPLRKMRGKMLGGKVVAGLLLNEGLLVAMQATLDGEANDAPLTPGLLDQCSAHFSEKPLLYVADRQFCDLKIPRRIDASGQAFVIRFNKKMSFFPERERVSRDAQGRTVREAWGWFGSPKDERRMYLRQITLERPGEEEIILVTNLLDPEQTPVQALLDVYLARWTIERVFQQVTEVFQLEQWIGSSPQGAVFQFALCGLLYNLIQVVRGYVAHLQQRPAPSLSSEMIFRSVCEQLTAGSLLLPHEPLVTYLNELRTVDELRTRLLTLLANQWSDLWLKSPAKKKRPAPPPKQAVKGGHSSAWKLIQAAKAQPPPR